MRWGALLFIIFLSVAGLGIAQTPNPVPFINQPLVPDAVAPGAAGFTLTVNGTGFVPGATVDWNGAALPTTFVSGSQLTASVPAANVATADTASVTVVNPAPGGKSNVVFFSVTLSAATVNFVNSPGSPISVGNYPNTVVEGDFNGDGKPDLAVANQNSNTVTILLGNGDGTFTQAPGSPITVGSAPDGIAVGDFNGDGKLDLAVANEGSNTVTILLGNGDGTFTQAPSSPIAVGTGPQAIAAGDFNADGKLDLAVADGANGLNSHVTILLGNGDGTFTQAPGSPIAVGTGPDALAVGDFNGDGKLDLAVANAVSSNVTILLGNGDGTFTQAPGSPISVDLGPDGIVAGDFNGDGKLDLAVAASGISHVDILLGNGDGTFTPAPGSPVTVGLAPAAITAADFNGDGKLDLATASRDNDAVTLLLGNGDGTFSTLAGTAIGATTGGAPSSLIAGDFNGLGRLGLATANEVGTGGNSVSILLQAPAVTLSASSLSYADQVVNTTSSAQSVTVTNSGFSTMSFSSIAASGPFAVQASGTTCSASAALAVGASCTVSVTFTPTATGAATGSLTLTDNAASSPQTVGLSGTGVSAGVTSLSSTSVNFGFQVVGISSSLANVTLTNTGTGPMVISAISATPADFAIVLSNTSGPPACQTIVGSPLAAGASCRISIEFTPSVLGFVVGSVTIIDDTATSPETITLTGTGVSAGQPSLSSASLTFTATPVGQSTAAQTLTLTNKGTGPLGSISITLAEGNYTTLDFSQTNNCPAPPNTLAVGASCTINVVFDPYRLGSLGTTLIETDDSAYSPQMINLSGTGNPVPFSKGELFFSLGNGTVLRETSTGQLIQIMDTGTGTYTYGMAFDSSDNLYVSDFGARNVSKFSNTGAPLGFFGSGYGGSVEDVVFNSSGDLIAGSVDGDDTIRIFDPSGNPIAAYPAAPEDRGIDWFDLAPDQCTLYYTSEGVEIKRFDICKGVQLSDFVDNLPGIAAYALRFLPSGGLLVADSQAVERLDSSGNIIQTYTAPNASELYGLDLDPDGTSFWTGDYQTEEVYRFDIATGALLDSFPVTTIPGGFGIAVNGEITVATTADLSVAETATPSPASVGSNLTYTLTVTNNGPNSAPNVTLTDTAPSGATFVSVTPSVGSCSGTAVITCDLGTLANAASVTVTLVVTPTAVGTLTNTASVSSGVSDPNPANNTATLNTTVTTGSITVAPASLTFAPQLAGTTSAPQTVTVTNNSEATVAIQSISVSAGSFAESNTCGTSLGANSNCKVNVTFSPQCAGPCHCMLSIFDNAAGSPQTVPLSGTGQDFKLVATTVWQTVSPGGSASYPFSIVPEGGLNTPVQFTCSGAPAGATCSVSPASVTLDGTSTASATVQVTTAASTFAPPRRPLPNLRLPPAMPGIEMLGLLLIGLILIAGVALARTPDRAFLGIVRGGGSMLSQSGRRLIPLAAVLLGLMLLASCGGGGGAAVSDPPGTPQGVYTLTITGTTTSGSATSSHSFTVTLAVN